MTKSETKKTFSLVILPGLVWLPIAFGGWGCRLVDNPNLTAGATGDTSGSSDTSDTSDLVQLSCDGLPVTAVEAAMTFVPSTIGLDASSEYVFSASQLPAGLSISPDTGEVSGVLEADPGDYDFDIMLSRVEDAEIVATASCFLTVNDHLSLSLPSGITPCLKDGESLLDLVDVGSGDGTPIICNLPVTDCSENLECDGGEGRIPSGLAIDPQNCSMIGSIEEDRLGTWVFTMRGVQSGADVFMPVCATNDEAQGYEISATHSGMDDAELLPFVSFYDPETSLSIGGGGNPRFEITSPGTCGTSCFYKYSWLRTNAPIDVAGLTLEPDGLIPDTMSPVGFFHELEVSGSAVPQRFYDRPWVVSINIAYCMSDERNSCDDPSVDGNGALEFGLIMIPE